MKIGIDLRPMQNGHKYRGIGEVAKQVTDRILRLAVRGGERNVSFVFYENDEDDPKELLTIPKGLDYEVVKLGPMPENNSTATKKQKLTRHFRDMYGSPIKDSSKVDVFLQFDYAAGVPTNTKTVLVKHDLIPYIFWDKYFESAWVPFKNKALRSTLRTLFNNHKFMHLLRRSLRNAHVIMTVSDSTRHDLEKYFRVSSGKLKTARLGVDMKPAKTNETSSGVAMPTKPYLIFVGAGDARRRVDDLVAAYNNLKAKGHDIQLVLVGENFRKPEHIPNPLVRNEVLKSSYQKDLITVGYVDDETKQKLISSALAYVYPTKYEGFGIPILEAMLLECPVVVYKNSSTGEVGGHHAVYVKDWAGIVSAVEGLMSGDAGDKRSKLVAAKKYAEGFTWDKTANIIYDELTALA